MLSSFIAEPRPGPQLSAEPWFSRGRCHLSACYTRGYSGHSYWCNLCLLMQYFEYLYFVPPPLRSSSTVVWTLVCVHWNIQCLLCFSSDVGPSSAGVGGELA